jgi:hypothetical protein
MQATAQFCFLAEDAAAIMPVPRISHELLGSNALVSCWIIHLDPSQKLDKMVKNDYTNRLAICRLEWKTNLFHTPF